MAVRLVHEVEVLRQRAAEAAAADDDHVERPRVALRCAARTGCVLVRAVQSLVQAVADETPQNVLGEMSGLWIAAGDHEAPLFRSLLWRTLREECYKSLRAETKLAASSSKL